MYKYSFTNLDGEYFELEITAEMQEVINDYTRNEDREAKRHKRNTDFCDREIFENHLLLSEDTTATAVEEKELLQWLDKILSTCTASQRRRFELFYYGGLKYSEIARHEKTSHVAVINSIKYVLRKLKKYFLK